MDIPFSGCHWIQEQPSTGPVAPGTGRPWHLRVKHGETTQGQGETHASSRVEVNQRSLDIQQKQLESFTKKIMKNLYENT